MVALALLGSAAIAKADQLVFSLDTTMLPESFSADHGVAQAVSVTSTTNIDGFSFFVSQQGGGDVDYFIYDETTSTLVLAPSAVAVLATPKTWAELTGIDITLNAGNEYLFGVYGSGQISVGMDPTTYSSIGLALPSSGPDSYALTGTGATALNVLPYVPGRILNATPDELAALSGPAWMVLPIDEAQALAARRPEQLHVIMPVGDAQQWRLLRLDKS